MENLTELEQLNLQVAAIAGWTDIQEWQPDPKNPRTRKTFQGVNLAHPELGGFVPNYVESLDAISKVFLHLKLQWNLETAWDGRSYASDHLGDEYVAEFPAIALCKLLVAINPDPVKPKQQVLEAAFG